MRDRLADHAADLSEVLAAVTQVRWRRLRLDIVTTNAFGRFHINAITARLNSTFCATGKHYGILIDGANPARHFTVPTGAPILSRGTLWSKRPKSGPLHRSPLIKGTGVTGLVPVLDPVDDPGVATRRPLRCRRRFACKPRDWIDRVCGPVPPRQDATGSQGTPRVA